MIEMNPVESSNIQAVGYDQDKEVLVIDFNSGTTYEYKNVPFDIFQGLMDADSVGSYFHKNVRTTYEYSKI